MSIYIRNCDYCGKHYKGNGAKYCSRECFRNQYKKDGNVLGFQKGDLNPSRKLERRKQISEQRKNSITSKKTIKRISYSMKKVLKNPELRKKWSECKIGTKHSDETKKKISMSWAKKPKKLSTLFKKLDTIYSKYIRLKYSKDGYVKCFTCDNVKLISEMDCGHFVGRSHKSTRYLEKNTHPQCRYCNRYREGEKDVYALRLQEKYGQGILEELNKEKNKIKRFTPDELLNLIEVYKKKIAQLDKLEKYE